MAWHVERAQTWLALASRNELVEAGDYYELPYVPWRDVAKAVFAESQRNSGAVVGHRETLRSPLTRRSWKQLLRSSQ